MFRSFPIILQKDSVDCGPTCLQMVAKYFGQRLELSYLRRLCTVGKMGVTLKSLSGAAEAIGLRSIGAKLHYEGRDETEAGIVDVALPCILLWKQSHYVVLYRVNKKYAWIADPAFGKRKIKRTEFERHWVVRDGKGIALLLELSPDFYNDPDDQSANKTTSFWEFYRYVKPYKKLMMQLVLGMLLGSVFSLIFPFLTQAVVDVGIGNRDVGFLYLILLAQLMLFISSTAVNVIQSWIFLHIGIRINVALIHDFLIKLTSLPIRFFNQRIVGDLLQRIDDHARINAFLTSTSLTVLFSFVNLIIFSIVLLTYSQKLFLIFWAASLVYFLWVIFFLKKRREVDFERFEMASYNQSKLIEIIQGIQELKLQNSEKKRRWQWINIQAKLFKVSVKALTIEQFQGIGSAFINELKNILLSFFTAKAVIDGEITLGMMLAIQYIIGQINMPLASMIGFVQNAQDATISFERLQEIHKEEDEEKDLEHKVSQIPQQGDLQISNLYFKYDKDGADVLKDIDLTIPRNKVTAIVGSSGSGKTTLIKLLLGFYDPDRGNIKIGPMPLGDIRKSVWRKACGVVMQDSYIFPDTIAHNIAESDDMPDNEKMYTAVTTANIRTFIEELGAGYNTVLGERGINLSQGQKQRLFIARAVYKNPEFLFFDEATNALDAKNEKKIMDNLNQFYEGRTVVVVAHRLSTVKNADQIIVLEDGEIIERGTHDTLVDAKGIYFNLVSNQLELAK